MQSVVVTGGAGFIGSHLCEALVRQGVQVLALDNLVNGREENLASFASADNFEFRRVDVSASGSLLEYLSGVDTVFHLAALADIVPSIESPLDYMQANVTGTTTMLDAARRGGVRRFVYAASSSCYGLADQFPTPEDAMCRPEYPYALSKYLAEQAVMHWDQVYGLSSMSLRFFNVYGPRARTGGSYGAVFGVFLAQKFAGQPLTIVGDGSQTRDFTYVSDVVSALILAGNSEVRRTALNVGTGTPTSVNRIAELIGGEKTFIPKRPGEPDMTQADISKIRNILGWEPHVSIEEGVEQLMRDLSVWKGAPVWTPDSIATATKTWFEQLGGVGS